MNPHPYSWVARKACGCLVGIGVDGQDQETGNWVGECIANGLEIERVPTLEAKKELVTKGFGCQCRENQQPSLLDQRSNEVMP